MTINEYLKGKTPKQILKFNNKILEINNNNWDIIEIFPRKRDDKFLLKNKTCKHYWTSTLSGFKRVKWECPDCNNRIKYYSFEEICFILDDMNITICMNKEDFKSTDDITYYCPICNNKVTKNLRDIKKTKGCYHCNESKKKTTREIIEFCESIEYEFMDEEYINNHHKHKLKCDRGHITFMSMANLKNGARCFKCSKEDNRGENHVNWNPNITQEKRLEKRKSLKNIYWRNDVFKRDVYTCLICKDNKGGNLNAHHLDGYNWCKERCLDITNGVTLCNECHKLFHCIYGYGDNTEEQYNEFVQICKNVCG